mmetsp:Transcript_42532/g.67285  ORF Transcript_42532/g.67285 Transcript_42532/m.67285 type:complete len:541 (+) Transcript_42532:201-1823(+)|eukprot:CAMPEP_0169129176 /NCGR_PEP_ID=MMETSP1015-20121227/36983_1 /TAXON_ID=342587 /ORGANISM="Karlodinium micrum, Strain CCMP2283" /LENGTH=540 /DNA_ID=CAMNT_0009193171 /DNA_START=200 /DNA_END=1822 /DNA_ORIENTATION=-
MFCECVTRRREWRQRKRVIFVESVQPISVSYPASSHPISDAFAKGAKETVEKGQAQWQEQTQLEAFQSCKRISSTVVEEGMERVEPTASELRAFELANRHEAGGGCGASECRCVARCRASSTFGSPDGRPTLAATIAVGEFEECRDATREQQPRCTPPDFAGYVDCRPLAAGADEKRDSEQSWNSQCSTRAGEPGIASCSCGNANPSRPGEFGDGANGGTIVSLSQPPDIDTQFGLQRADGPSGFGLLPSPVCAANFAPIDDKSMCMPRPISAPASFRSYGCCALVHYDTDSSRCVTPVLDMQRGAMTEVVSPVPQRAELFDIFTPQQFGHVPPFPFTASRADALVQTDTTSAICLVAAPFQDDATVQTDMPIVKACQVRAPVLADAALQTDTLMCREYGLQTIESDPFASVARDAFTITIDMSHYLDLRVDSVTFDYQVEKVLDLVTDLHFDDSFSFAYAEKAIVRLCMMMRARMFQTSPTCDKGGCPDTPEKSKKNRGGKRAKRARAAEGLRGGGVRGGERGKGEEIGRGRGKGKGGR